MEPRSYSSPLYLTYSSGSLNFASGTVAQQVKPPLGIVGGRVVDIHVRTSVVFTATTTSAKVNVGTVATAAKYAQLDMGTAAANVSRNFRDTAGTPINEGVNVFSDIDLARDGVSLIQLQYVAPTGGSPTGTGIADVCIAWY